MTGGRTQIPPRVLSEGRKRREDYPWALLAIIVGVSWLAVIGFAVVAETIFGWIF